MALLPFQRPAIKRGWLTQAVRLKNMCSILNNPNILNTIGLFFDLLGAILIGWGILRPFKGSRFHKVGEVQCGGKARDPEKEEAKSYEALNLRIAKVGIFLLVTGFILQICASLATW